MPWIIAGAAIIGGLMSSNSAKKGAKESKRSLEEGRDFAVNNSGLTNFKNSGVAADKTVNDLLGNNGGNVADSRAAFDRYLNSTGYKFQQQQGQQAITTNAASKGMLNSGATLKAGIKFGQNIGASYFNSYLDKQNAVANRGANAAANLASVYSGTGQALAGSAERGAAAEGAAIDNAAGEFGSYLGDMKGRGSAPGTTAPATGTATSKIFGDNGVYNAPQTPVSRVT